MNKFNKVNIFCLVSSFLIVFPLSLSAQNYPQKEATETKPAVETARIGPGASAMVSKGAKISEEKGILSIEDPREYSGRKFEAIELRLKQLEQGQKELFDQLKQVKEALAGLNTKKESKEYAVN